MCFWRLELTKLGSQFISLISHVIGFAGAKLYEVSSIHLPTQVLAYTMIQIEIRVSNIKYELS